MVRGRNALGIVLALGCRAQTSVVEPATPSEPEVSIAVVDAEPVAPVGAPAAKPAWCAVEVVDLSRGPNPQLGPTVGDRVAATDILAVVKTELSRSDCSSVGHGHAILVPVSDDGSGLVRAYSTSHLPGGLPAGSGYFLLGAEAAQPFEVDLKDVCIAWKGQVNAHARWVVPLADEAEARVWQERLGAGLCGRAPIAAAR